MAEVDVACYELKLVNWTDYSTAKYSLFCCSYWTITSCDSQGR